MRKMSFPILDRRQTTPYNLIIFKIKLKKHNKPKQFVCIKKIVDFLIIIIIKCIVRLI